MPMTVSVATNIRKVAARLTSWVLSALSSIGPVVGSDSTTETITEAADPGSTLIGSVGPGFEISLTTATRQAPGTLKPGAYQLDVDDKSSAHNFHLTGPGVNVKTSVGFQGTKTFTVTLKKGTYRFVCDPHATSMKGSFKVS